MEIVRVIKSLELKPDTESEVSKLRDLVSLNLRCECVLPHYIWRKREDKFECGNCGETRDESYQKFYESVI